MGGSNRGGGGGGIGGAVGGAVGNVTRAGGSIGTGNWGSNSREWLHGGGSGFDARGVNGWFSKVTGREGQRMDSREYQESVAKQNEETKGVLEGMKGDDQAYYDRMNNITSGYQSSYMGDYNKAQSNLKKLKDDASAQAKDASKTYSNTIKPELVNAMEDAKKQAGQAMSLKDAGNPNNAVHKAVREMYDKQAAGVGKQGLADAGVLSALGAQSLAGQLGGGTFTGGQMQAMAGANLSQSGQAYARAQQRMNDLRQQGIDRGFDESAAQYERGERARDRYSGSIMNIQNAQGANIAQQQGLRGEIGGYDNQSYGMAQDKNAMYLGTQGGMAGLGYAQKQGQSARELGRIGDYYGGQQAGIAGRMGQSGAQSGGIMGMIGQIGGSAAGGYFGGPGGAAAGGAAGKQALSGGSSQAPAGQPSGNQGVQAGGGYYNYGNGYGYPYRPTA